MISLKIEGLEQSLKDLDRISPEIRTKIVGALNAEGAAMEAEIKQELSVGGALTRTTASGRNVRLKGSRGGKLSEHSKPGEPPRLQTGRLRASIGYGVQINDENHFALDIGAIRGGKEVTYAAGLELGTARMAPRPYLMPVVKMHLDNLASKIRAALGR